MRKTVLSLYDYTGVAMEPWARAGYTCFCFDNQHSIVRPRTELVGEGAIHFVNADLHDRQTLSDIVREHRDDAVFMASFPVCTDLASSGAAHFKGKVAENPLCQIEAADHARWCGIVGDELGVPYFIENPRSRLATLWRKSDYVFEPYEYGGYLPREEAEHPTWPDYIAAYDAYPKTTYLWTGGGFKMPDKKPVECPEGYSTQHKKLGGKSQKTKNIRSATPRGFARAVFLANRHTNG